jgi:integrase
VTIAEYFDKWLKNSVRGSVRRSTFDCYEVICWRHIIPALGGMKLSRLTPVHVQEFYRGRLDSGLASASVHKCHTVLHKALSQAVEWRLIPRNVCDAVKAPRPVPKEEMRTHSPQERRRLLETAGDRLEALYVLAVTTGMRQGELLGLKLQDVALEAKTLRVRRTLTRHGGKLALGEPKTKKSRRTIHLTEAAVQVLKAHSNHQLE